PHPPVARSLGLARRWLANVGQRPIERPFPVAEMTSPARRDGNQTRETAVHRCRPEPARDQWRGPAHRPPPEHRPGALSSHEPSDAARTREFDRQATRCRTARPGRAVRARRLTPATQYGRNPPNLRPMVIAAIVRVDARPLPRAGSLDASH